MVTRLIKRFIPIIVSLMLVVFGVIGIFAPEKDYKTAIGRIVAIEDYWDSIDDTITYEVYIDYKANGKNFNHAYYPSYDSSMKIGDEVTVLYDPYDPLLIQAPGHEKIPYIVGGVGLVATVIFAIDLLRK